MRFRDVETLHDLLEAIPDGHRAPDTGPPPLLAADASSPRAPLPAVRGSEMRATDQPAQEAGAASTTRSDRSRARRVFAWLLAASPVAVAGGWVAWTPGRTSGGAAIAIVGVGIAVAIAVAAWPKTKEHMALIALIGLGLTAIGIGVPIALRGDDETDAGPITTDAQALQSQPEKARAGLPESGPTLHIWNKVTDGAKRMRDDDAHPAYLSTVPGSFCKNEGCAIPGTDVSTGDTIRPAICQRGGAEITNGNDESPADDNNPGLDTSDLWYGVRRPDDTVGYVSEIWVRPSQRGGLGLRHC